MKIGRVSFLEWDLIDSKKGRHPFSNGRTVHFLGGVPKFIWNCPFTKGTSLIKIWTKLLRGNGDDIHF
jgi:hypothetical protein